MRPTAHKAPSQMSREIERFKSPGNIEGAILLVVSHGLSDFIQNTVASIERSGASDCMICIALPQDALAEVRTAVSRWVNVKYVFLEDICHVDYSWIHEYHEYGTDLFCRFTASKWPAVRFLLDSGFRRVTYSDVDIAWMRNPMPLLKAALKTYDVAIQTEGCDVFPPVYCTGFMSFRNSTFTIELLHKLEKTYPKFIKTKQNADDQSIFNSVVAGSEDMIHRVFGLSEQLFANGLMARAIASREDLSEEVFLRRIDAMIFHANWTRGLENKRLLLARTGNWLIDQNGKTVQSSHRKLGADGNLVAELYAAKQKLDAVYASTSWRITAPFRRTRQWLNRYVCSDAHSRNKTWR
jgi:hypothetical protein